MLEHFGKVSLRLIFLMIVGVLVIGCAETNLKDFDDRALESSQLEFPPSPMQYIDKLGS